MKVQEQGKSEKGVYVRRVLSTMTLGFSYPSARCRCPVRKAENSSGQLFFLLGTKRTAAATATVASSRNTVITPSTIWHGTARHEGMGSDVMCFGDTLNQKEYLHR
ncbi:hypothetical protein HZH66_001525 [Vespula vulgaris]|uniref:Uncharacterized protein n=1 Tax=Vespula vulgaris TaxID=7454 RepID=A0A834KRA1_VESVU|nr:hypothetical protein HZH66_001525 [Vespula vulgaris]